MKTPSIFEIAIEALVTVSLIALLGLLTVLIYALLSFLSAEPTTQSLLSQIPTDVTTVKTFTVTDTLTTLTLSSAKAAPKLEVLEQDEKPEIVAEATPKPISKMTVQELRPLAKERKILNWRTLKKKELIYHLNV